MFRMEVVDPITSICSVSSSLWTHSACHTPCHAVHHCWNTVMEYEHCQQTGHQIFLYWPFNIIGEWPVTLVEHLAISLNCSNQGSKQGKQGCLLNTTMLAVGMKVMVTYNIKTDPDIAKGARGEIVQVILNDHEMKISPSQSIVQLDFPSVYILIKILSSKVTQLDGLEENVIPLVPLEWTFSIVEGSKNKTVMRTKLPLMATYAFTNYCLQEQTIWHAIIDIGTLPMGSLTPFNIYMALSQCCRQDNIQPARLQWETASNKSFKWVFMCGRWEVGEAQ